MLLGLVICWVIDGLGFWWLCSVFGVCVCLPCASGVVVFVLCTLGVYVRLFVVVLVVVLDCVCCWGVIQFATCVQFVCGVFLLRLGCGYALVDDFGLGCYFRWL